MWQIFMLTTLLALAGCKNGGGEYSQSVSEYATMQVAPVNKTLSTQGSQWLCHSGTDKRTNAIGQCADHSIRGTFHFGVGKIIGSTQLLRLGLCASGFCHQQIILGRFQFISRNDVLSEEFFLAIVG